MYTCQTLVYTCMYTCIYTCIYTFIYTSMYMYVHICVHTLVCTHAGKASANLLCKGIFGSCCGHCIPLMFVNIETGEKRVYLHYLLTKLIKQGYVPAFINYDIACRSTPYLKKFEDQLKKAILAVDPGHIFGEGHTIVAGIKFAIGRWHAYGHKSKCHSLWNMLYQKGFGLSDGEDMERIWNLLNEYAGATSQMNLGNHNDNLSLALLHILEMKCNDLPTKLVTVTQRHTCSTCTHACSTSTHACSTCTHA